MVEGARYNPHWVHQSANCVEEEAIAVSVDTLIKYGMPIEQAEEMIKGVYDVLAGNSQAGELQAESEGRWYKCRWIADIDDDAGEEVVGVIGGTVDITDTKARTKLEVENLRLHNEEQLAKSQTKQKSQFLAHMSHELRTPVSVCQEHQQSLTFILLMFYEGCDRVVQSTTGLRTHS